MYKFLSPINTSSVDELCVISVLNNKTGIYCERSFSLIRNKIGPSADPCGIPFGTAHFFFFLMLPDSDGVSSGSNNH